MTTTRMMMMASLALAALTAGLSGTEARGGHGGRGIAVGEPHPGGSRGHHGGWGHGNVHRHGGFHHAGWGYPAGGLFMSSYAGDGDCDMLFSPRKGRSVQACD